MYFSKLYIYFLVILSRGKIMKKTNVKKCLSFLIPIILTKIH